MRLFRTPIDLERRRAPRYKPDEAVCCTIQNLHTGDSWPTAIRDISLTGIALLVAQSFETGQLLTIQMQHAKLRLVRKYLVEVRHADICCPNDAWLHGCRFARPLRDDELRLWL